MIQLSRLGGKEFILNCELIKCVERTPDTLVTLTTGERLMVRESPEQIADAVVRYKRLLHSSAPAAALRSLESGAPQEPGGTE